MGVLYDYFRASDADEAVKALGGDTARFDTVPGHEPTVSLGQLIGFARDVEWDVDLVGTRLLTDPDAEEWVVELDAGTRDTLAGLPADRMPDLARRWADIEEFYGDAGDLLPHLRELVALAGRARAAGESLFVWMSL